VSDVMVEVPAVEAAAPAGRVGLDAGDAQLLAQLAGRAAAGGLSLAGEGGFLQQMTKLVLEAGLEAEMSAHLGYDRHAAEGRDGGNSRNGVRAKTVLTEVGPVDIQVPRDRDASFAPATVPKRVRRLRGVDEMVVSLVARGMTTGDVQAHLAEVYGTSVSRQQISTITDSVVEKMAEWQNRPLDAVYPVIFIDAINVKIRDGQVANRPIYVALAVTCEGTREVLGLWAGEHGDGEGAKYWLKVLTEIKNRGVGDVCMIVCDGLKHLPAAVAQVWPATIVQACIVHYADLRVMPMLDRDRLWGRGFGRVRSA
jgi:putative transposase